MHVNHLPDDCLRDVFDHFSLQHLIQLRIVCLRWRTLIENICLHKSSLKLFESFTVVSNYGNCMVQYNLLDNEDFMLKSVGNGDDDLLVQGQGLDQDDHGCSTGHFLADLFPNLTRLVFYYYNWPTKMELSSFLPKWSNLTSLALLGMPHFKHLQQKMWSAINSLPSLIRLHLFEICSIPEEMPIISQLQHFTLVNYDGDIVSVLCKLGSGMRHLILDGVSCTVEQFQHLLECNVDLVNNVTHLTIGHLFSDDGQQSSYKARINLKQILHLICTSFRNLSYFCPTFAYELPLGEQIGELVHLTSLSELRLRIHSFQMKLCDSQDELLCQLRSIQLLHLDYVFMDHSIELVNLIPLQFSNVHTLNITIESDNSDFWAQAEKYFSELNSQCQFKLHINDNNLAHYLGRHRKQYLTKYENEQMMC